MVALLDDEVPVGGAVVADDVDDDVVVGVELVEVLVELVVEVLDEVEVGVDDALQSWAASALTVPAPWPRFCNRVGLTDCGSLATELLSAEAALWAWAQSCEATAEETAFRLLARLLLWADESSPLLLPQATTNATVNPSPPARSAREPKPIRRLTLEAAPVCLKLEVARLLAVDETFGERVRQPGVPDRCRGPRNVVLGAAVRGPPAVEVELQPGGSRVAVTRLTDAARIDDPLALRQVELFALRPRLAGRRVPGSPAERQRDMRVTDERDPLGLDVQAQVGLKR